MYRGGVNWWGTPQKYQDTAAPPPRSFLSPPTTLSPHTLSGSQCFAISLFTFPTSDTMGFLTFQRCESQSSLAHFLLSANGNFPADALAVAQGVADFISMAALITMEAVSHCHCTASCSLVFVQLACLYTYMYHSPWASPLYFPLKHISV